MDEEQRRARIAANESVYRHVNEKIEEVSRRFSEAADDQKIAIVCECGDLQCAKQIDIDIPMYERVRSDPTLFIVVPGHDISDVEDIVEAHEKFAIVCKNKGAGADVARATDPRD